MALTKISRSLLDTGVSDSSDATAITIDSSEQVGIGTTAPNDYDNNSAGISSNLVVKDSGHAGIIVISGVSSDAAIAFGDGTGTDAYRGAVAYVNSADALYFKAGGNNKLRLDSDGLKFGTDTAAANALDDYEEGTWTPVHGGNNMTGTATYTKIGRYVYIAGDVTSATGSSTSATISGLPFTVLSSHHHGSFVVGWTTTGVQGGYVLNAGTSIEAVNAGTNTADTIAAGGRIIFAASYITA